MDRLGRRFDDPSRRYHDNADDAEDMQNPEHPADCPCFDENADDAEERQNPEHPQHPADCLCETCRNRYPPRLQEQLVTLNDRFYQLLNIQDRERTSASVTPRRPAGPRPSRSLPLLSPRPTRDLYLHPILGQFDTTTGSLPHQALPLGSQSGLPDIQQYAELGAQNQHAQPRPSTPVPNRLPAFLSNQPLEYQPPSYETQGRDGQNRHVPSPRPTHDQRRYSQSQRSGGGNPNLNLTGLRPAPYELPPAIPRHFVSGGINGFHTPIRPSPAPTGFPPTISRYTGFDIQNYFPTPARTSPTPTGFPPTTSHYAGSGGQNSFYTPVRPSPAPTGFPPTTPHYAGPGGENNFHVPTGPPPVLQQHRGNDGQSGFAQTGYSWAVQPSVTTGVQANRGNAVTQNGEEKDDFAVDSEEE